MVMEPASDVADTTGRPVGNVLIPVETYTREFDAKLLLACFLATAGFRIIIGSRVHMHLGAASLPTGIYLAKDFRRPSRLILDILRRRGCTIVALDEEGVVYPNPQFYYERRVDGRVFRMVDVFLAWGRESYDILKNCPFYAGQPIRVTGSPRTDMLTSKFNDLFNEEARQYRHRFGDFILINSNFGRLNHFVSDQTIDPDRERQDAGDRLDKEQRSIWRHRHAIFESFREAIPRLARDFADRNIVIRPHPSENNRSWEDCASQFDNVHVLHEGPVAPWLMAASGVIHNGCMTAVESFLLRKPTISYRAVSDGALDQKLPNALSHSVYSYEELRKCLRDLLRGANGFNPTSAQLDLANTYFATPFETLASKRITDALLEVAASRDRTSGMPDRLYARCAASLRRAVKAWHSARNDHKNSSSYTDRRFPPIGISEARTRLHRVQSIEEGFRDIEIAEIGDRMFEVKLSGR